MRAAWAVQGLGFLIIMGALLVLLDQQPTSPPTKATNQEDTRMHTKHMIVRSPAFNHEELIPSKYTCEEEDMVPPIAIDDIPEGTASLALIVDDPDAPGGTWDHWVLFNMPGDLTRIGEDNGHSAVQGVNSWGTVGYRGPCPSPGPEHRYLFKVYALDAMLPLGAGASKSDVLSAMEGHIIESTTLMGRYARLRE